MLNKCIIIFIVCKTFYMLLMFDVVIVVRPLLIFNIKTQT